MPPLHPLFVHFPVALLTVGFFADFFALVFRKASAAQKVGWWNLVLGTAGLVTAVLSGLVAKGEVGPGNDSAASVASRGLAPQALDTLALHEQLAFVTVAAFVLLLYWRIRNKTGIPPALPRLYLLLSGACIVLLWCTAWFGGELVYLFGVGVLGNSAP